MVSSNMMVIRPESRSNSRNLSRKVEDVSGM